MKATRWNPLQQFQSEMNRLFDRWNFPGYGGYPALNVWEDEDHCFVEAELPGIELKDLEITVFAGDQLTIKGERKPVETSDSVWHRQERPTGAFSRTLELPFHVDPEKVEAKLENGILTLKLAKHESARPRKIVVKAE